MKAVGNDRTGQERLVNQLVSVVPEFSPVLREHKEINGELLPCSDVAPRKIMARINSIK